MTDRQDTPNSEIGAVPSTQIGGKQTFMKAPSVDIRSEPIEADIAVVGIPFDGSAGERSGARYGPRALRQSSGRYDLSWGYDSTLTNVSTGREVIFDELDLVDCGDVPVVPTDIDRTRSQTEAFVHNIAKEAFPLIIGGDHYLTFPGYKGFAATVSDPVGIIQLDAHSDTASESALHGRHYNGSVMARVAELDSSSYKAHTMLGIRGHETTALEKFTRSKDLTVLSTSDIRSTGPESTMSDAMDQLNNVSTVYVTVDMDVVDPAFAPGVGVREPGGITSDEFLNLMGHLGDYPSVGALDLMEVCPPKDPSGVTSDLAFHGILRFLENRFL